MAVVALLAGLTFVACEKDNDNGNNGNGTEQPTDPGTDTVPDPGTDPQTSVGGFREDGASNALFSVSATTKIRFSKGNLQYRAVPSTWRFAENQYDFIGEGNQGTAETYDGWIDNFSWGTSGWESGATTYQPWQILALPWNGNYPGGSEDNDLTGDYAEADWAWHNPISNGGNQTHKWRTLTGEEWMYLTESRADAGSKLGLATVCEVHGLVILPDTWILPTDLTFSTDFSGWTDNNYTAEQWAKMEDAGAIFLPATGYSTGYSSVSVYQIGVQGNYWSASHYDNDDAYSLYFDETGLTTWNATRTGGRAVRPVTAE